MISRAKLDALFAEDDRRRAEHREFMAQREALATPPVSETDDAGLVYKDYQGNASQAAATAENEQADWSGWENWLRAHLDNERERLFDIIGDAMDAMAEQERNAVERQIAELKSENIEVKALLADALGKLDNFVKTTIVDRDGVHVIKNRKRR
jgi:hypothetical protein